jgi:hypothetical protein
VSDPYVVVMSLLRKKGDILFQSDCYGPDKKILFKKQLFDHEVKDQGPTNVITVHDTPPYGHTPTYQISLIYLERQKCYEVL